MALSNVFVDVSSKDTNNCRWLDQIIHRIKTRTGLYGKEGPNHVLLNAYYNGSGIYDHQDGPIYLPAACILSTGAHTVINFKKKLPEGLLLPFYHLVLCLEVLWGQQTSLVLSKSLGLLEREVGLAFTAFRPTFGGAGGFEEKPASSLLLQPRSLLVFLGEAYSQCCHGIDDVSPFSCTLFEVYTCPLHRVVLTTKICMTRNLHGFKLSQLDHSDSAICRQRLITSMKGLAI